MPQIISKFKDDLKAVLTVKVCLQCMLKTQGSWLKPQIIPKYVIQEVS